MYDYVIHHKEKAIGNVMEPMNSFITFKHKLFYIT